MGSIIHSFGWLLAGLTPSAAINRDTHIYFPRPSRKLYGQALKVDVPYALLKSVCPIRASGWIEQIQSIVGVWLSRSHRNSYGGFSKSYYSVEAYLSYRNSALTNLPNRQQHAILCRNHDVHGKEQPARQLAVVKALIRAGKIRTTESALAGAAALGLDFADVVNITSNLQSADFYKSMTSYYDHRQWQDVYRPSTTAGEIYLKLIVVNDVLVVSFKDSTP